MYGEDTATIIRCERCNKPFNKASTLKRHGYYCRSRDSPSHRARSCIACAKTKARCNKEPRCSRCTARSIECHYPASRQRQSSKKDLNSIKIQTKQPSNVSSTIWDNDNPMMPQENIFNDYATMNDNDINLYPDFGPNADDLINWDGLEDLFPGFLSSETTDKLTELKQLRWPSVPIVHDRTEQFFPGPSPSILKAPSLNPRSFVQRSEIIKGTQGVTSMIFHTLKSYPRMLARHKSLPPFIHPFLVSSEAGSKYMEPLHNCFSLMYMLGSGIEGSHKLFWRNVKIECDRLCQEFQQFGKWEALAASQALLIYTLVRLDEGQTEFNNHDTLLLKSVSLISRLFGRDNNEWGNVQTALDPRTVWEDWLYEESKRRLCVIYRVLNMLVYYEPAAMCNPPKDIIISPLPTERQLWEASNETSWIAEKEKLSGPTNSFGLATNGELVKMRNEEAQCTGSITPPRPFEAHSDIPDSWTDWSSGMDGLGGLVMLAASLARN